MEATAGEVGFSKPATFVRTGRKKSKEGRKNHIRILWTIILGIR